MSKKTVDTSISIVAANVELDDTSGLPVVVQALDFERLKHKFTATSDAEMTPEEWYSTEHEYRRFLALKLFYPGISLIPSNDVDKLWHFHILDTRAYREDCEKVFGRFIDHYPYFGIYGKEDYREQQIRFALTVELYERHFGPYPKASTALANRWQDDACQEVAP
ncbi:glycine-rich domain-containing protein [Sedimenticola thiotaurini]|uniref:Glycine-rich domain-containing protein-like n=1 Tax=Sedimenticola thiotaurini TaxID=1543721 RepID=A0A0F7K137_9GAMM|nr:hypothetical protein [Sedimenticola thiotaurini]AKH22266.1 hypothetical protein AAY24_13170 [Sedimenticola thiotaurini]